MATRIVTYNQLEHALQRLGIVETFRSASRALFEHEATGAKILLPGSPRDTRVDTIYLRTARRTIVENEIADEETFEDLLGQPSERE
jgi:hypothetical protein